MRLFEQFSNTVQSIIFTSATAIMEKWSASIVSLVVSSKQKLLYVVVRLFISFIHENNCQWIRRNPSIKRTTTRMSNSRGRKCMNIINAVGLEKLPNLPSSLSVWKSVIHYFSVMTLWMLESTLCQNSGISIKFKLS